MTPSASSRSILPPWWRWSSGVPCFSSDGWGLDILWLCVCCSCTIVGAPAKPGNAWKFYTQGNDHHSSIECIILLYRTNAKTKLAAQCSVSSEKDVFQSIGNLGLESFPSWVTFPDVEKAEWMNVVLKKGTMLSINFTKNMSKEISCFFTSDVLTSPKLLICLEPLNCFLLFIKGAETNLSP